MLSRRKIPGPKNFPLKFFRKAFNFPVNGNDQTSSSAAHLRPLLDVGLSHGVFIKYHSRSSDLFVRVKCRFATLHDFTSGTERTARDGMQTGHPQSRFILLMRRDNLTALRNVRRVEVDEGDFVTK